MSFSFNGKHIQKSTKTKSKRTAETIESAYHTQLAKGEVGIETKPEAPEFKSAMTKFLGWVAVEHRSKPNTVRSYNATSKALIGFFGDTVIDEIEPGDVEKFKQWRSKQKTKPRRIQKPKKVKAETKKADGEKHKKKVEAKVKVKPTILRPATINRELALLKIFFNHHIKKDILVKNPVSRVKFLSEDNEQMRVVSLEEEKLYLMAASQPLQDFATIMIDTGMRPEEVSRIERKNVFLAQGYLFIPFGKTKAAKRKIPLTTRVKAILESRLKNLKNKYVFVTEKTGQPITTLKTSHATAIRLSKIQHFRLYDLRHTFATRFIEFGGDLVTLQNLLGHSNIQMVTRYAHPTEKHQFESIKRMEAFRIELEASKKKKCA
jgi:integrase